MRRMTSAWLAAVGLACTALLSSCSDDGGDSSSLTPTIQILSSKPEYVSGTSVLIDVAVPSQPSLLSAPLVATLNGTDVTSQLKADPAHPGHVVGVVSGVVAGDNTLTAKTSGDAATLAFTGYPITDVARARSFYEGVLGLKQTMQFDQDGKSWIEYDVGPATLAISNLAGEKWKPSHDGPSTALEVDDFDAAIQELRAAKVTFALEPMDTGGCRMAVVLDPDGNSLTIHKRNAK